jgi:hypothetical protein
VTEYGIHFKLQLIQATKVELIRCNFQSAISAPVCRQNLYCAEICAPGIEESANHGEAALPSTGRALIFIADSRNQRIRNKIKVIVCGIGLPKKADGETKH